MKKLVLFSVMMLAAIVSFAQTSTKTTKKTTKKATVVNAAATTTTPATTVTPAAVTTTVTNAKVAAFKWEENNFNFGQIPVNVPVTHEFKFTNTGSIPLIVNNVAPACGCTVADYSKEPIAPGKTGYVKATYNAASLGAFHKSVTVHANIEGGMVTLTFEGEVIQK